MAQPAPNGSSSQAFSGGLGIDFSQVASESRLQHLIPNWIGSLIMFNPFFCALDGKSPANQRKMTNKSNNFW